MATSKKPKVLAMEDLPKHIHPDIQPEAAEPVLSKYVLAGEGDSYASIASLFKPQGKKLHDFALELVELNHNATIRPGVRVRIAK